MMKLTCKSMLGVNKVLLLVGLLPLKNKVTTFFT